MKMILKDFLAKFIDELNSLYDKEEARSLFFIVLEEYSGISRTSYVTEQQKEVSSSVSELLKSVLSRLRNGEPLQYIFGKAHFYGMELKVNKHTLIPRPETEELVDIIRRSFSGAPKNILDVGTGSGCIAIALKSIFEDAVVDAMDISTDALEIAEINAFYHGKTIHFIQGNFLNKDFSSCPDYDIIVSNPPYITLKEKREMHVNVLDHEPHSALFVPKDDPLIFYKVIEVFARDHLRKNGKIYLEINQYLGTETLNLFIDKGWKGELLKDLSGNDRFLRIEKHY